MGSSISNESNNIEVLDMFSFRVVITSLCLRRKYIPDDVIHTILKIMNLIYGLDIIQEAKDYGWKMTDDGRIWEFKSKTTDKTYIDIPIISHNVIYGNRLPKYLYVKSFRRIGEQKCLICDKDCYNYYKLHNVILCGKCRIIYESNVNHKFWTPYYKI